MNSPPFQQRFGMSGPNMAPPWLCEDNSNGQKYLYNLGLGMDGLLEKMREAMLVKCPGFADPSAIPFQADDRVFVQGPGEDDGEFVNRLKDAFNAWAHAGSRLAVLGQLQAYFTDLQPNIDANTPEMLIVGGNAFTTKWETVFNYFPQGLDPYRTYNDTPNWNWDGEFLFWRDWLVLFMHLAPVPGLSGAAMSVVSTGGSGVPGVVSRFATHGGITGVTNADIQRYITVTGAATASNNGTFQIVAVLSPTDIVIANTSAVSPDANDGSIAWSIAEYPYIGPAPVWGAPGAVWGDGANQWPTWGINCSHLVTESIRAILDRWKSAGTYYPYMIVSFGGGDGTAGNEFSPLSGIGTGNPDGQWGTFGAFIGEVYALSRAPLNPFTSFCDGTGLSINCFSKNKT